MFYKPGETEHGLPYDPFKVGFPIHHTRKDLTTSYQACVVPRAIGWISTVSRAGEPNLAPYSQFTNVSFDPPMVMFSSNQTTENCRKDTVNNVESTGVFCWQLATYDLREAVNITAESIPPSEDEFKRAGLEVSWSKALNTPVPMVRDSPVRFECEYIQTVRLPGNLPMGTVDVVFGKVVAVHIADHVLTNGKIDVTKTRPIARLGYFEYGVVNDSFEMIIPGDKTLLVGVRSFFILLSFIFLNNRIKLTSNFV